MKNYIVNKNNLYFTSDTHFFHKNIMKHCSRKFETVDEMNEYIIEKWNEKIPEDAIVFHLGDVSWKGESATRSIIERLNGRIILVRGNHDNSAICSIFAEVNDMARVKVIDEETKYSQEIHLCHFPIEEWDGSNRGSYHIHGHQHSSPETRHRIKNKIDVGMDGNDLVPYSFNEIIDILNQDIK